MKTVKITYSNDDYTITSVNPNMSNEAVREYFAIGSKGNIGNVIDRMATIVNVEISE